MKNNEVWPCGFSKNNLDDIHRIIKHKNNALEYKACANNEPSIKDEEVEPSVKEEVSVDSGLQGHTGTGRDGSIGTPYPLADVLDEVADFNRRFVYHKDDAVHDAIALWVVSTYGMDKWFAHPRIYITAPQAGAGKSTQGKVVTLLSNNGVKTSSATVAAIFAKVSEAKGNVTILLDEADNIWAPGRDNAELQGLINDGFEPGATVLRGLATDKGITSIEYPAYCPVAIIGIKNSRIPATTLSRCIKVNMTLPNTEWKRERFSAFRHAEYAADLSNRISEAVQDIEAFQDPEEPEGLTLRDWDVWIPLFVIAEEAGGDWPARVRKACAVMTGKVELTLSPQQKVLTYAGEYFIANPEVTKVKPQDLADYINGLDELFALDGQKVSYYLKNYGIEPKKSNGIRAWHRDDILNALHEWMPGYTPTVKPSLADPADPDGDTEPSLKSDDWQTNPDGEGW